MRTEYAGIVAQREFEAQKQAEGFEEWWKSGCQETCSGEALDDAHVFARAAWQAALKSQPAVEAVVPEQWLDVMIADDPKGPTARAFRELKAHRQREKGSQQ